MFRSYATACVISFLTGVAAMWAAAERLMPPPRVSPTMAHRMAVCGEPRLLRRGASLHVMFAKMLWFELRFSREQKIRHFGDQLDVEGLSLGWFGRGASSLTDEEAAFVAAVANHPRIVKTGRIATAVQDRLTTCGYFPMQKR